MKSLARLIAFVVLAGPAVLPAQANFSSLYVFGDTVSTTTNNTSGLTYYWGNRYCNGRVWVEVLAQRQGLTNNTVTNVNWSYSSNNWSYYFHSSTNLLTEVGNLVAPANASTALFVVWVCDADFVGDMSYIYPSTDLATWNSYIHTSLTNHFQAITNLYAKGARTLIMPNAVDITEVQFYQNCANRDFIRGRVMYFNAAFAAMLNQARALLPGIKIYMPDFFALLDNFMTNAASYGFINTTGNATDDGYRALDGPGANYLWWDWLNPTAKAQEIMADLTQQLLSPVTVTQFTVLAGSNRLDVANLPIGLNGFVDGRTDLAAGSWAAATNFNSTAATEVVFVPAAAPGPFYRLRFPFAWSWP
jgi:phospholipase/lecithinase/hemolysin